MSKFRSYLCKDWFNDLAKILLIDSVPLRRDFDSIFKDNFWDLLLEDQTFEPGHSVDNQGRFSISTNVLASNRDNKA